MTFIEQAIKAMDIERVVTDVMSRLVITNLDLYFVVDYQPGAETYDFVGMAYSLEAAKKLLEEEKKHIYDGKILRFDMGKLVTLVEKMGGAEKVS